MNDMFYGCEKLNCIDLSNFNSKNVTNMNHIFDGCKSLTKKELITKDKKIKKLLK